MYNNYIEYEDDYGLEYHPKKYNDYKKYFKYIIIPFVLVIGFFIYRYFNSYKYYEKKLINAAQKYIQSSHINTNNELYIDSIKLNVKLPSNCSLASGVLYDGRSYKAILECSDYKTSINQNNVKEITLLGDDINIILKGIEYEDPGYISNKEVITNGNVGTEEGVYNINYYVGSQNITRKVIIVDNALLLREYPNISLNGEKTILVDKGTNYMDMGVTAYDNVDGDITKNVQITNLVNTNNIGEYKVIYKVTNSRGYNITKIRKIVVSGDEESNIISGLSTYGMTNKSVKIIFNILSSNYSNTVLPNNEVTTNRNFEYEVEKNDTYIFKVNDVYGNTITRKVEVTNIDKELPKISCVVGIYPNHKEIQVINESNKSLSNYKYIIDGVVKVETINNIYQLSNTYYQNVEVEVTDSVGNITKEKCEEKNMDPTVGNNFIKYYVYNGEEYVIANTKNDLNEFHSRVCNKIAQVVDKPNCGDACLSFAEYYALYIQRGDMSKMNEHDACNYNYGGLGNLKVMANSTKEDALRMLYNEIINGRVAVLQVTGTKARVSRHFYTVVGYRRSIYNPDDLREEDLLAIDSWTGCFATLNYNDLEKRTMFDNKDGNGYRVNILN